MPNQIKLTNYPYQEFKVGDICDFGEEKNKSLVAFGRAVFYEEPTRYQPVAEKKLEDDEQPEKEVAEVKETIAVKTDESESTSSVPLAIEDPQPASPKKKLIQNKLKEKVQEKTQSDSKSFWDRLR